MEFELSSSQDEHGSEWVKELEEMNWMDKEVRTIPPDYNWQLTSYIEALGNRYDNQELERSNLMLKPCDQAKRVSSFDTENFFMFQCYTMAKFQVKPLSWPFSGQF